MDSKSKNRKESPWPWTKCFHHGRGKVTALTIAQEWSLDLSNLFIGQKFYHGAHSHLYKGLYKEEYVAVKILSIPYDDEEKGSLASLLEAQFIREVTFLPRLHHQNVVKFIAACKGKDKDNNVSIILTEFLKGGSLRAYLNKLNSKPMPLKKVISFALDIARGMEYIHSQGIIHRDLKPENVLVGDDDSRLKIADFGIACEAAKNCDSWSGTYRWMAPEMIKKKRYGRKVDVYSFGLMLWEMVTGTVPYKGMTPVQVAFAVSDKNLRPVIPSGCPSVIGDLIQKCWAMKPEKRPEFLQVVQVLEKFDLSLLAFDDGRAVNLVQNHCGRDHNHHKKPEFLHWIQKIGHVH
ncbi:hypothetical protein RIF29_38935 [Crotalaria pallida]|uniref:Protein kinase domain-containing protein n=1 Tax=Crotalaria pallida TaxID=3830 RepID=A0AAN9E6H6_CROPI